MPDEVLIYDNIFDSITNDVNVALKMKEDADQKIKDRAEKEMQDN